MRNALIIEICPKTASIRTAVSYTVALTRSRSILQLVFVIARLRVISVRWRHLYDRKCVVVEMVDLGA